MVDYSKLSDEELLKLAGQSEEKSFLDAVIDVPGKAARMAIGGAGSVVGLASDPIGDLLEYATGEPVMGARDTLLSTYDQFTGDRFKPQNEMERVAQTAGEFMVGGGAMGLAAKAAGAPAAITSALSTKTPTELASMASGGAAFGVAQEAELSPAAQLAATMGASLVPMGATSAAQRLLPKTSKAAVDAQLKAGGDITVGGVLGGSVAPRIESGLSQAPMIGAPVRAARERVSQGLSRRLDNIADAVNPDVLSALDDAGQKIRTSIASASEKRIEEAAKLYDDVFAKIPDDVLADTAISRKMLKALLFENRYNTKALKIINDGTLSSLTKGNIPARELKIMRPQIKDMADNAAKKEGLGSLAKDINKIYVQVNNDIKATASRVVKGADQEMAIADSKFKAALDLDERLIKWIGDKTDESLATSFKKLGGTGTAKTAQGANVRVLEDIAEVLPPDDLKNLSGYMMRTMGRNSKGALNPVAFADEYLSLNPKARAILFGKTLGKEQQKALDKIVSYASSSKVSLNPPGTAANILDVSNIGYALYNLIGAGTASLGVALMPYAVSQGMASKSLAKLINKLPRAALNKPVSSFSDTQLKKLIMSREATEGEAESFNQFLKDPHAYIMDTSGGNVGGDKQPNTDDIDSFDYDYRSLTPDQLFNIINNQNNMPESSLQQAPSELPDMIRQNEGLQALPELSEMTKRNEGLRLNSYPDMGGRSVGYGFNMDSGIAKRSWDMAGVQSNFNDVYNGHASITLQEAEALGRVSKQIALRDVVDLFPEFADYSEARQMALLDMSYQMGKGGLSGFKKARAAIDKGNWTTAAREILKSKYAKQTPNRANRIARMLING